MFGPVLIFAITYLLIATEKMDKTAAALLGASAAIILHLVPYKVALAAVDLNVVFLLVGMMIVVGILARTGVFEWLAVTFARASKGNGVVILLLFLAATAVLSAALDNVTTVILIAPITILICELLELPTTTFLVLEAIASNIGGTSTLIGDPPNVLIASATGLSFNAFLINLGPPVLIMLVIGAAFIVLIYRKEFQTRPELAQRVLRAYPERAILEPETLKRALVVFAMILVAFFASHSVGLEPGIIALAGALLMAVVCEVDLHHVLEKVEWNSVFFFIGLFMLIGALEHNHVFEALGHTILDLTQGNFVLTVLTVMWFAALASAIVDNIPLVIAMIPLIETIIPTFAVQMGVADDPAAVKALVAEPLYWSLALGACLGGNGSLVGASANVVIAQIARRNNYDFTFWAFTRRGLPVMLATLVVATGWLYLRFLSGSPG